MKIENLLTLQNDLDICINGQCYKCKYKEQMCTDSLIDYCAKTIGELIELYGRENNISNIAIDGNNSQN